ncbi:hypothetical protein [Bifidobacterium aesculapii]|uniref:hypothetical protein n=1 Tax=Bifidobacterium aesculapii TaxID=1329411 RepID=UPI0006E43D23|nr:hypothetical protein [Bifidobacterium aesculapii]
MGYEQLSTIIVLVIVLIGIVAWLPVRTAKSMRHVEEHREDRFSSSLHLVDEHSGTRFSDDGTYAKGVLMQPNERRANTLTPERIAEVRRLRREAVRRRQILVAVLSVAVIVVAVVAFPLHFSPWFALIPAAMEIAVLALGARAAGQARAWERKVARARARERRSRAAQARAQVREVGVRTDKVRAEAEGLRRSAQMMASAIADDVETPANASQEAPTDQMERREIRRVLRQAEIEQRRALAAHGKLDAPDVQVVEQPEAARAAAPQPDVRSVVTAARPDAQPEPSKATAATAPAAPSDATAELVEVRSAGALDPFDIAVASQDLISFSLGEARNTVDAKAEAPESREIKSTRQVAKASPLETDEQRALAQEAKMETAPAAPADHAEADAAAASGDGAADADRDSDGGVMAAVPQDAGVSDVNAFHESEAQARVAVPAATSDSLGNDLQAILARRGS